jgi:hypothetical protein
VARGQLRIDQGDYGITPFAVGGGAIQVADTLEIRLRSQPRAGTAPAGSVSNSTSLQVPRAWRPHCQSSRQALVKR